MKKIISLFLLLSIVGCLITFTVPSIGATEIQNYGIDIEDTYLPDLPTDLEPSSIVPSSYDPREDNALSSVKHQRNQGTCSIFASIAALESKAAKVTGVKNQYSEEAVKFLTSNALKTHNNLNSSNGYYMYGLTDGRNINTNIQYLTNRNNPIIDGNETNWISPNYNLEVPYTYNANNDTYLINHDWPDNLDSSYANVYVSGMQYIDIEEIKENIIDNGAVYITMCFDGNYFDSNHSALYNFGTNSLNHAVTIVGWDDNYEKENFKSGSQPSLNGAWLIKNSWGSDWGDNGYFWISYYDLPLNNSAYASVITDVAKVSKNEYMLSYDYTPMTNKTQPTVVGGEYYIANVYDMSDYIDEYGYIDSVMFYASNINDGYEIYIAPADNGIPDIDNLGDCCAEGGITHEGYITEKLNSNFVLDDNCDSYAIIIKFNTNNSNINISSEKTIYSKYIAQVNRGESYYYSNDCWIDVCGNSNKINSFGNYCIRPMLLKNSVSTSNSSLSNYVVNNEGVGIDISLTLNGNQLFLIKEKNGSILYEDMDYTRNGNTITFSPNYVNGLSSLNDTKIVFEFTDGADQELTIKHKKQLSSVSVSGKFAVNQTLTATTYAQDNTDVSDLVTYQWQYSSTRNGTYSNITGATQRSYNVSSDRLSDYIRVIAQSVNGSPVAYPSITIYTPELINGKVILYGDVDSDGSVTVLDAALVQRYTLDLYTMNDFQLRASDVNGDGCVDIIDSTFIQKKSAGVIDSFPVEQ